jgi:hypothetical protein
MSAFISTFLAMAVWHAIADYPLQGDFLAKAKSRAASIPGVPWFQALGAHALIHAGGVGFITGSVSLGVAEFIAHSLIDDAKCMGRLSFNQDQALHLLCKLAWAAAIPLGVP